MGSPRKPDAQRRRRNPTPGFRLLPHEGRNGPTPEWPLPDDATTAEWSYWDTLWSLPQAVEWERMRAFSTVAWYVRLFVQASGLDADPKLIAQAQNLDVKIGVSPKAMAMLRWETDDAQVEADDVEPIDPAEMMRQRVKAVE